MSHRRPAKTCSATTFEDAGLICRSVGNSYYGVFLSYKIERPVLQGDEADTHFSANVISDTPADPASYDLEIDDAEFDYLKDTKTGTLRRRGILGSPRATLEELVHAKRRSNYIYSLSYSDQFAVRGITAGGRVRRRARRRNDRMRS